MVIRSLHCLLRSDWSMGISRGSCINSYQMFPDPTAALTPSPNRSPTTQTLTHTRTPPRSAPRRQLLPLRPNLRSIPYPAAGLPQIPRPTTRPPLPSAATSPLTSATTSAPLPSPPRLQIH